MSINTPVFEEDSGPAPVDSWVLLLACTSQFPEGKHRSFLVRSILKSLEEDLKHSDYVRPSHRFLLWVVSSLLDEENPLQGLHMTHLVSDSINAEDVAQAAMAFLEAPTKKKAKACMSLSEYQESVNKESKNG